ncbi:hypothetical protein J7T55_007452 [Diaporthe amygdali]|uniref:uncharacterized protein n=1 Tax=Phomopsis amygdali TaxID=1214568 RepID=UPI0022FF0561|nr:uncharacterized protein J7T55_007452 [Diaporthe amygdali]KAJ0116472.1 hypothetical protein J7T55_007452 [Diaporthe amygdali]
MPNLSSSGKLASHFVQYWVEQFPRDEAILQDASPFQQIAPNRSIPGSPVQKSAINRSSNQQFLDGLQHQASSSQQ